MADLRLKPKVMSYRDVPAQQVPESMARGTTIRWLITREDGSVNFAMRYFTVDPNGEIYSHSHPWEHGIFIVKGKGEIEIDKQKFEVSEGTFVFVPPDASHSYRASEEGLEFICVIPDKGY